MRHRLDRRRILWSRRRLFEAFSQRRMMRLTAHGDQRLDPCLLARLDIRRAEITRVRQQRFGVVQSFGQDADLTQHAHREITLAAQPRGNAGPDAANAALTGPRARQSQCCPEGPLCLLRHCRELSILAKGPSGGGTLLAQNALQPELGRANNVGHVPPDQAAATATATKALSPVPGVTSSCSAVNHLLKSVVREIRTLRSVGTGGGRPPPVTRCWG